MRPATCIRGAIVAFVASCAATPAQSQPPITFAPMTPTEITVPENGTATVQYVVTNRTQAARTYIMQPLPGVLQMSGGLGTCAQPINLLPLGNCLLALRIVGSQLPATGVADGPTLCRQGAPTQCYRPAIADMLRITRGPAADTALSVTPSDLSFAAGEVATLSVTNVGDKDIWAGWIAVTVPAGIDITADMGTCDEALPAGETCQLLLAALEPQPVSILQVHASNAPAVDVQVTVTPGDGIFVNGFETPVR